MGNIKCFVIPVIIEATEIATKNIWKQYQERVQKILYKKKALFGKWHIIRELLPFRI